MFDEPSRLVRFPFLSVFCKMIPKYLFPPVTTVSHALASFRLGHTQGISTLVFVLGKSRVRCGPMSRLIDFYRARRLELLEYCDRGLRIIRQIRLIERGNRGGKREQVLFLGSQNRPPKRNRRKPAARAHQVSLSRRTCRKEETGAS